MACELCEDTGESIWLGHLGQGGRKGPCPRCRISAAKDFSTVIFREFWPPGLTWATDIKRQPRSTTNA